MSERETRVKTSQPTMNRNYLCTDFSCDNFIIESYILIRTISFFDSLRTKRRCFKISNDVLWKYVEKIIEIRLKLTRTNILEKYWTCFEFIRSFPIFLYTLRPVLIKKIVAIQIHALCNRTIRFLTIYCLDEQRNNKLHFSQLFHRSYRRRIYTFVIEPLLFYLYSNIDFALSFRIILS